MGGVCGRATCNHVAEANLGRSVEVCVTKSLWWDVCGEVFVAKYSSPGVYGEGFVAWCLWGVLVAGCLWGVFVAGCLW